MPQTDPDKQSAQEQARHWLVRQHSGEFTPAEHDDFERWLGSDSAHREAYTRAAGLWRVLDDFKSDSLPAHEAARAYHPRTLLMWYQPRQLVAGISLGLAAIVGLVAAGRLWLDPAAELYRTQKGEQRDITLADGSRIELNTDSAVRVEYTRRGRIVRLESGEAMFTVSHGDERPFDVIAGAGRIRDIGTRFNVYKHPDTAVSVAVAEGSVSVTTDRSGPLDLVRGDRISYTPQGILNEREHIDALAAGAWLDGKLVFTRTPLIQVMGELARYHDIEFTFASPDLGQLKLSGTFGVRDLPLFLYTLAATLPVETHVDGRLIHLSAATATISGH